MAILTMRAHFQGFYWPPYLPFHNSKTFHKSFFFKLAKLCYCYSVLHLHSMTTCSTHSLWFSLLPLYRLSYLCQPFNQKYWWTRAWLTQTYTITIFRFFSLFMPRHSRVQSWTSILRGLNFKNYSNSPRPHIANIRNRELLWILSHRAWWPTMSIQRSTDGDRQSRKLVSTSRKSK